MIKFQIAYFCVECEHELSDKERSYSKGVCPYCGHIEPGTICATTEKARQFIRYRKPWWMFWSDPKGFWRYK